MTRQESDLVISAALAWHLSNAIKVHGKHLREKNGSTAPPEYPALSHYMAQQARAGKSLNVTGAQSVSIVGIPEPSRDSEQVTADTLLTYRESADRMNISLSTLRRRVAAGDLRPVRHGRITRLRVADIDAFHEGAA